MTEYVYAVIKDALDDEPGIYVFISNKKEFEETGYASDHDFFPMDESGKEIDLGLELEELMEGCYRVEDETLSVKAVQAILAKCPRLVDSLAFKALIRRTVR